VNINTTNMTSVLFVKYGLYFKAFIIVNFNVSRFDIIHLAKCIKWHFVSKPILSNFLTEVLFYLHIIHLSCFY